MNEIVKASIDGRKAAFYNAYNITDETLKNKIEDLFSRINTFGEDYSDSASFEAAFAFSPFNQEYIDLFTEVATTMAPITYESNTSEVKSDDDYIKDEINSELKYQAESLTQPMRRKAYQETYDAARDIPVVGNVLDAKQKIGFFSRFKKNKDE